MQRSITPYSPNLVVKSAVRNALYFGRIINLCRKQAVTQLSIYVATPEPLEQKSPKSAATGFRKLIKSPDCLVKPAEV